MNGSERPRIVVVDYGAGNLRSVSRALAAVGADVVVTDRPEDLATAAGVILPGVGAAGSAMRGLAERGLVDPLKNFVRQGRPFLGVCLGLQVLLTWSDEFDGVACLGIVPGKVVRLSDGRKIPHMGWNQVKQRSPDPLFEGIPDRTNFYFVHSFVAVPDDSSSVVGVTEYGGEFASVLRAGNVVATQFHPEKSAEAGLAFYRNFTTWVRATASPFVGATRERA